MAKIVETVSDDAKAKARHAKIANEKKEAEAVSYTHLTLPKN